MKCFNCGAAVPDHAVRCLKCEADLSDAADLTPEGLRAVEAALEEAAPGMLDRLREMAFSFDTAEDFVNAIFVGACPDCGDEDVGTFEGVKGIEDPTIARCYSCGHVWCGECRSRIENPKVRCGHWDVCDACPDQEECPFLGDAAECPEVSGWLSERTSREPGATLYRLDVWLIDHSPRKPFRKRGYTICRTIEILGNQTLAHLHECIFDAFDRVDEHMYEFRFGGKSAADRKACIIGMEPQESGSFFGDASIIFEAGSRADDAAVTVYAPAFVPSALVFGKAIHESIRHFYQTRLEGRDATLPDLMVAYEAVWDSEDVPIKFGKTESRESLRKLAEKMLTIFANHAPESEVLALEERLTFRIRNDMPEMVGYADLIERLPDGTVRLVDFKTTARKPSLQDGPGPEQLLLYGLAAGGNGLFDKAPVLQYTVLTKTKNPEVIDIPVTPTAAAMTRLHELAVRCWRAMCFGVVYPCPGWQCAGCGYKERCDRWPEG